MESKCEHKWYWTGEEGFILNEDKSIITLMCRYCTEVKKEVKQPDKTYPKIITWY